MMSMIKILLSLDLKNSNYLFLMKISKQGLQLLLMLLIGLDIDANGSSMWKKIGVFGGNVPHLC